jgi:dienelactone hydrolase
VSAKLAGIILVAVLLVGCSSLGGGTDSGVDLSQPGPYRVEIGTTAFSRQLPNGETRTVPVHLWYPARDMTSGTPTQSAAHPLAAGARLPLIVFSHGSGASALDYSFLLSHLASYGFVVAGPDHRDCQRNCTDELRARDQDRRPVDVSMVVDALLAANSGDNPLFHDLVDPDRIGVAGQSFGAWTTLTELANDPRFKAGLAMNPGVINRPTPSPDTLTRPLLLMAGVIDAMAPYAPLAAYFEEIPRTAPDHYLLSVQQAGHEFHEQCIEGFVTIGCRAAMPQPQLQGLAKRVGTAFLLKYVAGKSISEGQFGLHDANPEYAVLKGPAVAPTPRPLPSSASVPEQAAGTVLLQDDLNSTQGGALPTASADPAHYDAGYANGEYEVALKGHASADTPMQAEMTLPGTFQDSTIAVDAELLNPNPSALLQLACRSQGPTSQYRFTFRPATSMFSITRWITLPQLAPDSRPEFLGWSSPAIHPGEATNHVELRCAGTTIEGRINGVTVASIQDNTYVAGQAWIGVAEAAGPNIGGAPTIAHFHNLVVTQQ